jgi:arsenite methyltransferase
MLLSCRGTVGKPTGGARTGAARLGTGCARLVVVAAGTGAGRDRWAEWLIVGRDAPLDHGGRARARRFLSEVRDRVLDGAQLAADAQVLDLGAGTGLLALEARRRVETGGLVAFDLSRDALTELARLVDHDPVGTAVRTVQGDAVCLPFGSRSFDTVVARSVLVYVDDKRGTVGEIYRVLRPGGRVSVFEPINAAAQQYGVGDERMPDALRRAHIAVRDTFEHRSEHWRSMMDFDERDLTQCFVEAGFTVVGLVYELLDITHPMSEEDVQRSLVMRGNPTAPTWAEAAHDALGGAAEDYLHQLVEFRTGRLTRTLNAVAYLTATRP